MKKMMFLLVVVLLGFQAAARKGQPILPYGDYSIEDVRTFALSDSEKAKEFRMVLVPLVQRKLDESGENLKLSESHVSWIFDQVVEQEAWLEARQFKNSRWMPNENIIEFYVSETRYEGSAGIFVYGKCSFPLYKTSCANLLEANLNRVPSGPPIETEIQKHTVLRVDTIYDTYAKKDTIFEPVWVEEPERFVESRVEVVYVEQPHAYYEPIFRP
ncbi:MAG: hypothetical protein PHT84_01675, partial [Candidatus Pacebacteria bacterium]|nr:hypothetical protein [Candidatus Paceibacterota bacterium]